MLAPLQVGGLQLYLFATARECRSEWSFNDETILPLYITGSNNSLSLSENTAIIRQGLTNTTRYAFTSGITQEPHLADG
ncbi:MAG TPA: hypothetical protein VFN23_17060 [Ktedonobacteraceae bacterium]|nr:hypothetical protein [Ktedonobacteraceae bacterium]